MIGKTVSHYKILEKIGAGGMGIVYKAHDTKLDRFVALKFLPPHLSQAEEEKLRFIHEARAASALDHKNICNIHEIGETEDGQLFITMAFYEGESLKKKIENGPLPLDEAVNIAYQIAQGLAKAHALGIIHRDIKPANVMITGENEVKVLDFGLAKLIGQTQLTRKGTTLGTVAYMSPEQTRGTGVDSRTDIWALGALTYEMMTGRQPFTGDYEQAVIYSIINEEPVPPDQTRPEVPVDLSAVIYRMLAKDPESRYQTAEEVLSDLRAMRVNTGSVTAMVPPGSVRHFLPRRPLSVGISSAVILMAIAAIWMFSRYGRQEPVGGGSRLSEQRIAVLPFSIGGNRDLDYLGDSMVELLSIGLNEAGGLESVEPNTLLGFLGNDHGPVRDPKQGGEIAAHFGAGHFILGSVIQLGEQIRFNAAMYNNDGKYLNRAVAETSEEDKLPMVVDSLMVQLIGGLIEKPLQETVSIAAKTTHSFKALKAYLQGLHLQGLGKEDEAYKAYSEATRLDSTFALAWLSNPDWEKGDRMIKKYWNKLPKRNQCLYKAEIGMLEDDSTDFEVKRRQFLKLVEDYPDFAAARFIYADYYLIHEGWISGHPSSEGRPYLEKALKYQPNNAEIIHHLPELVARAGEFDVLDSLLIRYKDQIFNYDSKAYLLSLHIISAAGHNDQGQFETLLQKLADSDHPGSTGIWLPIYLVQWLEDIPRAAYAHRLFAPVIPAGWHGFPSVQDGIIKTAAGQLQSGDSALTAAYGKVSRQESLRAGGLILQVLTHFCTLYPADTQKLLALRAEIEQWDTTRVGSLGRQRNKMLNIALISYRLGDDLSFEKAQTEIDALSAEKGERSVEHAMAATLQALVNWKNGKGTKALTALDDAAHAIIAEDVNSPPGMYPMPGRPSLTSAEGNYLIFNLYLRAEILFSEENYRDALSWYAVLNDNQPLAKRLEIWGLPFLGPSLLRRAQICEHLGEREKAAGFYRRLVRLWKNCDPELRPYVAKARERIETLAN